MPHPAEEHHFYSSLKGKLEIFLAVCALITSITSIWLSLSQGDDMQKLVQAQSWPFLGFSTGNTDFNATTGKWDDVIDFEIENLGVGPAKIKSMEVWYKDKPMANIMELLQSCCHLAIDSNTRMPLEPLRVTSSTVPGRVLRAGQKIVALNWLKAADNTVVWNALNTERFNLKVRMCYCSVFDECWMVDAGSTDAKAVKECPVPKVNYTE